MAFNTFGRFLRVTTWGESHGPAIGCVVDGAPPGLALSEDDIQPFLDRRRPGQSRYTTQRREPDIVRVLSGTYDGLTTGAPIALMIETADARPKDYSQIAETYRPGHADYSYEAKYGRRDPRGGGRASARETAMRVAAGAVARKILGAAVTIRAALVEMGGDAIDRTAWDWAAVEENAFFSPDRNAAARWGEALEAARKAGDSLGAVVEVVAEGVPAGWGAPVYAKLDADLAGALMAVNAAKGVEIGAGFEAARLTGSQNADEMRAGESGGPEFLSNNAGGILGGISSGQPVVARLAVKPTSSIAIAQRTITRAGADTTVATTGRHDPCVGIRAVPVAEAVVALVLADHMLLHRGQCGETAPGQ